MGGPVLLRLQKYITIENQSPDFDPTNKFLLDAAKELAGWVTDLHLEKTTVTLDDGVDAPKKTPLILVVVEATKKEYSSVLLYGHLDKQPPLNGEWSEGLGPYPLTDSLLIWNMFT
jgi:acetylornithine deacetylase/succinyl-diaminopimelate desuccinylase-like protein